jgi:hypothetical protein
MDNLDKIIPVIIILVSFIVSIVQNVKKEAAKRQQSTPKETNLPPHPQQIPTSRNTVFKSAYRPIEQEYQPEYQPEEIENVVSVFSFEEENNSNENILAEEAISPINPLFDVQNTDEIKRAIIYTEILGRKYE